MLHCSLSIDLSPVVCYTWPTTWLLSTSAEVPFWPVIRVPGMKIAHVPGAIFNPTENYFKYSLKLK